MSASTVTVPLWVAVVLGALALIALVDRLFAPAFGWWMRRRVNRAIDELNQRLKLKIPPFKLARRRQLIEQLMFDPDVLKAVEEEAKARGEPKSVTHVRARRYAKEIIPAFSAYAYFRIGTALAKRISTALYRVRIGAFDESSLYQVPDDAAVVFVINHRSNMDYVLVTYLVSQSSALSYAVGEWARVWALQSLIRAMGGYFVRRDSSNPLYRKVLARYVHMATASGVAQAVFPEGGLTRDGSLRPPKLGLLSYMVSGFDPQGARDIVFVPVGLNYDRVLEDRILTAAASTPKGERPSFAFNPLVLAGFLGKSLWQRLRGAWHRYGYACVSFGRPLSLRDYLHDRGVDFRALPEQERFSEIAHLGKRLMQEVGNVVPALPVSLVASAVLADGGGGQSSLELKGAVAELMERLKARGAHVHIPRQDQEYAVEVGLRMLLLRHIVLLEDGVYRANPKETMLLAYYANAIAHLLGAEGAPMRTSSAATAGAKP
ncbi:MAG: glycerol-3-phosphate acyltransferase [Hyphomicrobiaceae bacterium]|nr:MAG: glycerol-3-phosphate acyltransferase [Hyphomicrobiaceae bacterium]